jgi:hypothetical protein
MITTKISIKPHVCEYVRGKYAVGNPSAPVRFPAHTDIYFLIWDLLVKRPAGAPVERGNLEIVLPARHGAKSPQYYNWLGARAQQLIGRRLEMMMWADYRQFVEYERHHSGAPFVAVTEQFLYRYGIESLSDDAFRKSYYRWRCKYYGQQRETG